MQVLGKDISLKKQLLLFFTLSYGFSWSIFFFGYKLDLIGLILLGVWGPSIVSIILTTRYYGKAGLARFLKRFGRYKIRWYWWVLLIFLPAAIHLSGKSLWQIFYEGQLNFSIQGISTWLGVIIPSFIIAGFGEELGWRGFALARLQKIYSPLRATFILALLHLFWHLPTYWLGQGIHNVPAVYVMAFVFPWTVIFNWLYNRSGGSLIFAVSFHGISNASLSIIRFMPPDSEILISPDLLTRISLPAELSGPYLSVIAVYMLVAILIILYGNFKKVNTDIP